MMNTATTADLTAFPSPAPAFLHADGPGDVPLDEGGLAGMGEPPTNMVRGGCDLDGAATISSCQLDPTEHTARTAHYWPLSVKEQAGDYG
jgi:hypothetical protein